MVARHTPVKSRLKAGFTLIELSIVLVIVGLIIGGVLVGRDLISAAIIRSQISQIEKYNAAVNTFRGKYGYLPGDIPDPYATQYGFHARGSNPGQGDANGLLEGVNGNPGVNGGAFELAGETAIFWEDLNAAGLIEGSFNTANYVVLIGSITGTTIDLWFPKAKIGTGNYVYVYSVNNFNYYAISAVQQVGNAQLFPGNLTIPVIQAQNIDQKIDDGLPQLGNVTAQAIYSAAQLWAAGQGFPGAPDTSATVGLSRTCYDNSASASGTPGVAGAIQHYSVEMSGGSGLNCSLSIQFH